MQGSKKPEWENSQELENYFLRPPTMSVTPNKMKLNNSLVGMDDGAPKLELSHSFSSSCERCDIRYRKNRKKLFKRFCQSTSAHGFHNLVDEWNENNNQPSPCKRQTKKSRKIFSNDFSESCNDLSDDGTEQPERKRSYLSINGRRSSVSSILPQTIIRKLNEPRPYIITGRRLLWLLIITIAAIGFTVHLTFLIMRYLELRVNTQTEVMASRFVFPDVTVCSTDTFSKLRLQRDPKIAHLNLTFSQMLKQTRTFWQRLLNVSEHSGEVNSDIVNSLKVYLHQVNVTSQAQDMIVHCHYKGDECSFTNFTFYADPVYMGCFTFSPEDRYLIKGGEKEGGLKVIVYAGDGESYISDEEALSYFKGMRVVVHPKGTRPNLKAEGFYAETSHNTIVQLGYKEVHVLDKPNRRCYDNIEPLAFVTTYSDLEEALEGGTNDEDGEQRRKNVRSFTYTLDDCHIEEYQMYLLKTCDCVSESLPVPLTLVNQTKNFCHRISDDIILKHKLTTSFPLNFDSSVRGINKTAMKRECHDNSIDIIHTRTANTIECSFPCFSEQYNMRITRANWPNESDVVSTALKNAVRRTLHTATKLNYDTIVLENLLANFKSINVSRNFLKLDVYAQSKMGDKVEETWVYPARNLFSDLGGILGLWLGVSTITLFEFFELGFNLLREIFKREHWKNRRKRKKQKISQIKLDLDLVSSNDDPTLSDGYLDGERTKRLTLSHQNDRKLNCNQHEKKDILTPPQLCTDNVNSFLHKRNPAVSTTKKDNKLNMTITNNYEV